MTSAKRDNEILARDVRSRLDASQKVAFVSGNFNVVHPGHLRLLNFASECADCLIVGVHNDREVDAVLPGQLRLDGVQSIGIVTQGVLLPTNASDFIRVLKPDVVVMGKEHEGRYSPQEAAVASYGGRLLFSSGEARFSSMDLLKRELEQTGAISLNKPNGYMERHGISIESLVQTVAKFEDIRVTVIGDLIVDEYITCEPLGMSQEDPTIVVTPLHDVRFVGGAAIVAAHSYRLGASVCYFGVAGHDEAGDYAARKLSEFGVQSFLIKDESRPTTLKRRYRAREKTLLRVNLLKQHEIAPPIAAELFEKIESRLAETDLLIFSDFNYGCLPQSLVDRIVLEANDKGVMMAADSQSSSQIGDISRFKGMALVTPTEREARLALRDNNSGLVTMANKLRDYSSTKNVILTLGAEGILIHAPQSSTDALITDRIPAMNSSPKDVAGAGDCLLTCAAMSLAVGANIWQSAYLGSVAAACQVAHIGNTPLAPELLLAELYE